ncbi:MAG: hypothetical protein ACI83P_002467 [Janthinobacterium sp.]|jgi:hypothetical protein
MPSHKSPAHSAIDRHQSRPDWPYHIIEADPAQMKELEKLVPLPERCCHPCTKVITLLPKTRVNGHAGVGYQMINIDGFRYLNAHVVSDALNSTAQRGFTLELSFSLNPFVPGVGVVGESDFFYSFDGGFLASAGAQRLGRCQTSDLTIGGGLPRIGGVDMSHILRVPVLGPYVRASIFNEDGAARSGEVRGYLTT